MQGDILEHRHTIPFLIGKVNLFKIDRSVLYGLHRIVRIGDIGFFVQNRHDTLCAGTGQRHHNKDHRQHHQAHQDIHAIRQQTHQLPGLQTAGMDQMRAQPADQQDAGIHRKLHQRRIDDDHVFCLDKHAIDVFHRRFKLALLMLFTHICLDHANRTHIFLHGSIQFIITLKYLREVTHGKTGDQDQAQRQKDHRDQINTCHGRGDQKCRDHGKDHGKRRTEAHPQDHLVCILQIGHIRGQTGNQSRRGKFIDICKGKGLDMIEHSLAQILGKSGGCFCRKHAAQDTGSQTAQGQHQHQKSHLNDMIHIAFYDTVIHDRSHQHRDRHLKDDLKDHTDRRQDRRRLIFLYLRQQLFQHCAHLRFFY